MRKIGKINIVAVLIIVFCMTMIMKIKMPAEVKSVECNGIIATVEDVQVDKNRAIVEVDLYKQDGSSFEENTRVGNVKLSSKKGDGLSWHTSQALSNDQKVLRYIFKISKEGKTKLKDLNIQLNELVIATEKQKILEESIYDLYKKYPLQYDYEQELPIISYEEQEDEEQADEKIEMPKMMQGYVPIEEVSAFSILGVGFNKNSEAMDATPVFDEALLHIRTRFTGERQNVGSEARLANLYNEVTGEKIDGFYAFSIYENNEVEGNKADSYGEITEEYFELTNTEKLKHIKPVVNYITREKIGTYKWDLSVSLKENVKSIKRKVNLDIQVDNVPIRIKEVYISAIGATIAGEQTKQEEVPELIDVPVALHMKDGSIHKLTQISWATDKAFSQEYSMGDNNVDLIDVQEIKSIEIAGKTIELLA